MHWCKILCTKSAQRCSKIFEDLCGLDKRTRPFTAYCSIHRFVFIYIYIYLYKSYFIIFYPGRKSFVRLFSCVHLTFLWFPLAQSVGLHFCGSRTARPCHVEPCPASLGCCASINCSATKEGPGTGLFKKWWRERQLEQLEQESKWESRQIQEQDKEDWDCGACLTMCLHSAYEILYQGLQAPWNEMHCWCMRCAFVVCVLRSCAMGRRQSGFQHDAGMRMRLVQRHRHQGTKSLSQPCVCANCAYCANWIYGEPGFWRPGNNPGFKHLSRRPVVWTMSVLPGLRLCGRFRNREMHGNPTSVPQPPFVSQL